VNAVKFTDRGDVTVLVSANLNDPASGSLHFTVCDTGIGIPADRLPFIFDSFTQASASTARTFGGSGLGLAISKRFAELMGGRIWAESTLGAGTKMHFTAHFDSDDVAHTGSAERTGLRCLVVDDNINHRAAVAEILTGWGAEVEESDGPASARERTGKAMPPYDLVLVDARMQTSDDGFGLAARLKQEQLARKVVVMLTTDRLADATHCRELGLAYLLKPVRRS
jgi:CheY-like chemotaxis protein